MTHRDALTDLPLATAVYRNYCQMWRSVGALAPPGSIFEVRQRRDMLLIRSHLVQRVPHLVLEPFPLAGDTRTWATDLVRELTTEPVSLMVGIPPGLERGAMVDALRAEGFVRQARPTLAMAGVLDPRANQDHDSAIALATGEAELEEGRALLARIFGLPSVIFAFYTPPAVVNTYVLSHEGMPVAAACLCPFAGSAGIYSVGVLPTMRGRGFARRLVRRALADATNMGYTTAVLSCEPGLAPLYQRLGFAACWELMTYWLEAWWR